jgi:hypothetical protein
MLVREYFLFLLKLCTIYYFPRHQFLRNLTMMLRLYVNFMPNFAFFYPIRAAVSILISNF